MDSPKQRDPDPQCYRCNGTGVFLHEDSHKTELWFCPCTGKYGPAE